MRLKGGKKGDINIFFDEMRDAVHISIILGGKGIARKLLEERIRIYFFVSTGS